MSGSVWRRVVRWPLRILAALLLAFVLTAVTGAVIEAFLGARDERRFAPPGRLIDVGGNRMHLYCTGDAATSEATVVLEAGLQLWSSSWYWVQRDLEDFVRVCSYDRFGQGWSELGPGPYDARSMMTQLHALLAASGETGPYVLVGHSLGGMLVRVFYTMHPNAVAGMVLVDPGIPTEFYDEGEDVEDSCGWRCPAARALASLGVFRWVYRDIMRSPEYPHEVVPEIRALLGTPPAAFAVAHTLARVGKTALQTMENDDLGDIPLVVLRSTDFGLDAADEELRVRRLARRDRLVSGMQAIVRLSTGGRGPIALDGSNHESIIMYERFAREVADEIGRVVVEFRASSGAAAE